MRWTPPDLCVDDAHSCIQWRPAGGETQRWRFEMAGEPLTLAVAGPLIVSHCDAARVAALQDVGVAYVLETYAAPFTDTGRLVSLLSEFLPPFGESSAISNTSASRPPREPSSTLCGTSITLTSSAAMAAFEEVAAAS